MVSQRRDGVTTRRDEFLRRRRSDVMTKPTREAVMSGIETHTLDVDGTKVTYDVRGDLPAADGRPPLMLIGSPMDAAVRLAGVVLHRPDGGHLRPARHRRAAPEEPNRVDADEHADDLHAVMDALGAGPVDLFASSGGAVNAWRSSPHIPSEVGHARGPRAAADRGARRPRGRRRPRSTTSTTPTRRSGLGPAMAKFIAIVSHRAVPRLRRASPIPTPACSGCRPRTTAPGTTRCWPEPAHAPDYHADVDALERRPRGSWSGR